MQTEAAIERIKAVVGPRGWIADPREQEPYLVEARGLYRGATRLVVRPASTAEVSAVVRICAEAKLPIVPQGGNTGLVGGGVPPEDGHNIVLALGRMNRIRAIDPVNFTMTVEAGCILADLQQAAAEADRLFPLSLGAEGSCQIGGNLSTNAGGIAVLRYGNTRELTLGLEVVLADGRIWDGLRGLRKDNTGYDLKQFFIGGEGTLGVITAATVKLYPKPREVETAFLGLSRIKDAMGLFARARAVTADQLTAFELIPRGGLDLALAHGFQVPSIRWPRTTRGTCSSKCRRARPRALSAPYSRGCSKPHWRKDSSPTVSSPRAGRRQRSYGGSAKRSSRRSSIPGRSSTMSPYR
jgi:FAD/FMN-containing dehydrogenase